MRPLVRVPAFERKCATFVDHKQRVRSWGQSAERGPSKRVSMLILPKAAVARHVCPNAGGDTFTKDEGVGNISKALRNYFQPAALDRIHQQATEFLRYRCAYQTMGRFFLELDGLRREAEEGVIMAETLRDASVSILRAPNASAGKCARVVGFPHFGETRASFI